MNNKELLIHCNAQSGFNRIFEVGEYGMKLTGFGLLVIKADETWHSNTGNFEVALVLLGGKCQVLGDNFAFNEVGGRRTVFDGKPYTIYLPRNTAYTITGITDVEIAVNISPCDRDTSIPTVITPEMTRTLTLGRDNFTRSATIMINETFNSQHFYIGEGLIPSGNWSGYPPHRHDIDNPPEEIDMEETYFYRFDPKQGFGIQKIYTSDYTIDKTYTVTYNDTVAIAQGYHPLCCAPGYKMYYLWTMTGLTNRGLISSKDPQHAWVK